MAKDDNIVNDLNDSLSQSPAVVQREIKRNIRETVNPGAGTTTTIYNCFGGETITGINICNTGTSTVFWIYIVPIGGTAGATNAVMSNVTIAANESKIRLEGITPARGDTIQVKSTSGNVCFTLFGKK